MPAVACKVGVATGMIFKVVLVSRRTDFFSGDVVKKLQLSLFCIIRRIRYCLPVCACYRPPSTVTCLHYCRLSYRRLPSLSPLELLVTAYNADVREAIVYRLQSLQACDAGLGFGG